MKSVNSNSSVMIFVIYCTLHYTLCYRSGPSLVHLGHGVPPKTGSSIRKVFVAILKYCHAFHFNKNLDSPLLQHFLISFRGQPEAYPLRPFF